MRKENGVQLPLAATIGMRWSDLPAESRQRARAEIIKLLQAAAGRARLTEPPAGGAGDE